ncbi:hypothetical protein GOP47_0028048 [Adiantum capillus-veneris]|nr:hypothetical protein GOP47_0028048 [Adiantum capillus-veneris]
MICCNRFPLSSTRCRTRKTRPWPCRCSNRIAPIADNNVGLLEGLDAFDVIVVGAGVSGSALAYALGKDGRKVWIDNSLNMDECLRRTSECPRALLLEKYHQANMDIHCLYLRPWLTCS